MGNYDILLVEDFPCNSKKELERREGEYIKNNFCICVNKYIAGRTDKEYREQNKEQIAKQNKKYQENNRETKLKKQKVYDEKNKEKKAKQQKEKVDCPFCSNILTRGYLSRHIKNSCKNKPE